MITRKWCVTCIVAAISVSVPAAYASVATAIKQEIQGICNQADSAASRKDVNAAVAHYGDPGLQDAARRRLGPLLSEATSAIFSTHVVSVDVPKDNTFEATVVLKQHFQGLIKHNGRIGVAVADGKIRQYWTKQAGGWKVMRERVLSTHRTFNSQTVKSF